MADPLRAQGLPHDGASARCRRVWLAEGPDGLFGCAGTEAYGDAVLLRSLAVRPEAGGRGVAVHLCLLALEQAAEGRRVAYLLTATAADLFPRLALAGRFSHACSPTAATIVDSISRPGQRSTRHCHDKVAPFRGHQKALVVGDKCFEFLALASQKLRCGEVDGV
jgi:GNAT superfamily N-acetyltransferase